MPGIRYAVCRGPVVERLAVERVARRRGRPGWPRVADARRLGRLVADEVRCGKAKRSRWRERRRRKPTLGLRMRKISGQPIGTTRLRPTPRQLGTPNPPLRPRPGDRQAPGSRLVVEGPHDPTPRRALTSPSRRAWPMAAQPDPKELGRDGILLGDQRGGDARDRSRVCAVRPSSPGIFLRHGNRS